VTQAQVACKRVLVIGGCGYVGHLLAEQMYDCGPYHEGQWFPFDKQGPHGCSWQRLAQLQGDVTRFSDLWFAMKATDSVVYMAEGKLSDTADLFAVSAHGVYNALMAARSQGVRRFILVSSLSVFSDEQGGISSVRDFDEDAQPCCDHPDAVTALNSEMICEHFAKAFGMSIVALRLSGPRPDAKLRKDRAESDVRDPDDTLWSATAASDILSALYAAVDLRDHTGFDVVNITGDLTGARVNLDKAKRLLGWEPTI